MKLCCSKRLFPPVAALFVGSFLTLTLTLSPNLSSYPRHFSFKTTLPSVSGVAMVSRLGPQKFVTCQDLSDLSYSIGFDFVKNLNVLLLHHILKPEVLQTIINLSYVACLYFALKLILFFCPTVVGSFSLVWPQGYIQIGTHGYGG